jgi:putative ATPase
MHSGGDARKLLNILEILAQSNSNGELVVSNELVRNTLQKSPLAYDKAGEWHYDIVFCIY